MSLTHTAFMSRNIIKYGGIGVIFLVFLWMSITTGYKIYRAAHPIYVAPTQKYGVLPAMVFPEKEKTTKNFYFEFPNDATPQFSDQARVYILYRSSSSILALENDKKTAAKFEFTDEPVEIKTGVYEFKNSNLNKTLTMNVLEGSFKLAYPYMSDQLLLNPTKMPSKSEAIEIASSYLESGDKFTDDLENGEKKVSFWKIQNGSLIAADSQSEGNVARVDFYRSKLNNLEILSNNVGQASISVLVSGSEVEDKEILEVDYKDLNVDSESYSTYPIKTAEEAIEALKSGNYWPVSDLTAGQVTIRNIYLAYFEPVTLTNYLQPIFVFEGDNNFVAYVPAISTK